MPRLPKRIGWLFWDADVATIDVKVHANAIIPRILEKGRLVEVRWLLRTYGKRRIHTFLRDIGDSSLSAKTLTFWRVVLKAQKETWHDPSASRPSNVGPWIS